MHVLKSYSARLLKFLLLPVCCLLATLQGFAQVPEQEPNNSFELANAVNPAIVTTGSNSASDQDYFSTTLPLDGAVKIYVQATNASASNAYLYLYGYDSRMGSGQILAKYAGNTLNVLVGQTVYDTIILYGRAAEAFYLRFDASGAFNYSFRYEMINTSDNDVEPNNDFSQPLPINRKQLKSGHTGYVKAGTPDADDYYKAVLPIDGSLKIFLRVINKGGTNGYSYLYVYDARQGSGQVLAKYVGNTSNVPAGDTLYDTITLNGRSADDFYFRLQSSTAFDYIISYDITDSTANDTEPNNTFETALSINRLQELKGHISYVKNGVSDADDYYKTTLTADGTLKIIVEGTNLSGASGYLYLYGYDGRKGGGQVLAKYIGSTSNALPGQAFKDTITLNGRAADTFYFRIQSVGAFDYSLKYDITEGDVNDVEPNNTFADPTALVQLEEKKGHIGYVKRGLPDPDDYYKTVLPIDGTLKVYIKGTNKSGSSGYLYLYGYDRRKGAGQIFATYIGGTSNVASDSSITDSITIYGILADTFYFRIQSVGAFDYSIKYNTTPNSQFDEEPNNTFDEAFIVKQGIPKNGQIGYQLGGIRDNSDYYKTFLPADGTLKIYVQGTNNSGSSGYLYLYGYDKRKGAGQVLAKYINNTSNTGPAETIFDTIYLYGRAADSFYFRFESVGAFSYSFSYDVLDTSANDVEPNNTFEEALSIERLERKSGHLGYAKNGTIDGDDYYKALLNEDGTLKIIIKGLNRNSSTGYLYLYAYDGRKSAGQILAKYIGNTSNVPGGTEVFDTIYLYGRAADTVYFRLTSVGAFNYSIDFDLTQTSETDIEPNNTFEQAISINANDVKKGHTGYIKNGVPDPDDFYKTFLPTNGSLKIYLQATNRNGTNGYAYIYGYDQRKGSGQILAKYIGNTSNVLSDSSVIDSITLYGRASDTFYFRIQSVGAFTYSLNYKIADTSILDVEPNNNFEQALVINAGETRKGNIGYIKNGTGDADDYYKTKLPLDGTVKIYVEGKNRNGASGYMYLYGYDSRKDNGQVLAKYISNSSNIANDSTIYDTIYLSCRAVDSFYFRVVSVGAFGYSIKYEMQSTATNDAEPNNTFTTATLLPQNIVTNGHISYVAAGVVDDNDYYKTHIQGNGLVRIIVEGTNTSGANGYLYLYGYDNRKGSGQILAKYIKNNGSVLPGATIRDTIILNCYKDDTLFTRFISAGCFNYSFKVEFTNLKPRAAFDVTRVGNTFGFNMQQDARATGYTWNFGNNTTSNKIVPSLITYKPGFYQVSLVARNATPGCNFTDTAKTSFTIKGIERYTPTKGGKGVVAFTVYGGGLTQNTIVKLTRGSTVIIDSISRVNVYGNIFSCLLDLHNAPLGMYDVDITTPDSNYHFTNGLRVEDYLDKLKLEVIGRSLVRISDKNIYKIRVHNEGNVIAGITEVLMLLPPDVNVKFLDSLYKIDVYDNVDPDTIPEVVSVTKKQGFPIDGNLRGYIISNIPQGGFRDLSFLITFTQGVKPINVWVRGPYTGSERPFSEDCLKSKLKLDLVSLNYALDVIPVVDCGWNLLKAGWSTINLVGNGIFGSLFSTGYDFAGGTASYLKTLASTGINCAGEASFFATGPGAAYVEGASLATDLVVNSIAYNDAYKEMQKNCDPVPEEKEKKDVDARTSFDPNAKVGPPGYGANRYIKGVDRLMNYAIFFENIKTATLPAQEILVLDTLDKNVFNLKTFKIESFGIGINSYSVATENKEYVTDININDSIGIRLNIKLDTLTGILKANFKTIDRKTGDLTTDPIDGFLPPNVNSPEGDGYFTYSIQLKEGLSDGTKIKNKATIIFDKNAPIDTDVWSNTLDNVNPTSSIISADKVNDTTAIIRSTGFDASSKVEYYKLYVSKNGGSFDLLGNMRDTLRFVGALNDTYNFYVVAIDSVGNVESKVPNAEATVIFSTLPVTLLPLRATKDGAANRLQWTTLTEQKNKGFVVERSDNGRTFLPIDFVASKAANGFSNSELLYGFVDANPTKKAYYRLKQTDLDSRFVYSNVVTLDRGKLINISVYPNPAKSRININSDVSIMSIQLLDMSGKLVRRYTPVANNSYSLDGIKSGLYLMQVTGKEGSEQVKLLVQ